MATVYYDFDSVAVNLSGSTAGSKTTVLNATQPNPTTNIQYNNVPYFLRNLYFAKSATTGKAYLIAETTSDPQSNTDCLFIAIQLNTNSNPTFKKTEIDKLFEGSSGTLSINLSSILKDGDSAKIRVANNDWPTVVVDTAYDVIITFTDSNVMNADTIEKLQLTGDNAVPAKIRKQIFGWNMSCTLVGEDEAGGEVNIPTVRVDTMDTIGLLVVMLLIVSSFYLSVPIIYKYYIIPIAMTRPNLPLASIEVYWTAISTLIIISFISFGIKLKDTSYYFFAFAIGIILYISKKWVKDNIGNIYSSNKAGINVDFTANPKISNTPPGIDTGYFSVFTTAAGGFNYKAIIAVFVVITTYLGINISAGVSGTDKSKFTSALISFMGISVFTTAMFMDKINWKILFAGIFIAIATTAPTIIFKITDLVTKAITK